MGIMFGVLVLLLVAACFLAWQAQALMEKAAVQEAHSAPPSHLREWMAPSPGRPTALPKAAERREAARERAQPSAPAILDCDSDELVHGRRSSAPLGNGRDDRLHKGAGTTGA